MRSHMRGGASRMVGRTLRISCGSFSRLSAKVTGIPRRSGNSSITTRWAMWADGRKATVASWGQSGSAAGHISMLDTTALWVTNAIFGSPVAPEVRYRMAVSDGSTRARRRANSWGSRAIASRPMARRPSSVTAPSASPVSRIQRRTGGIEQGLERLGIFDEDGFGACGFNRANQIFRGVAGVHRGGDGAVGHDAEIGEIELQAGFGIQGDDVAFRQTKGIQAGGDLLHRLFVLVPGIGDIARAIGLAQRRRVAILTCRFFQNLVDGAGVHSLQFSMGALA